MSDGEPRPLLFYSRRRDRRRADDEADDEPSASAGDRAVRPRPSPDAAIEAPASGGGGTPRHARASPRAPPPVAHAPDDSSTSTPRRGLVPLSRLGAGGAPARTPPGAAPSPTPAGGAPARTPPGAAPSPTPAGGAPAPPPAGDAPPTRAVAPLPSGAAAARGAWANPLRHPQAPRSSPSTAGPLQPGGAFRSRSPAAPAAPVTPVSVVPRAVGQRGISPHGASTGKVDPKDMTPRDINIWYGIRHSPDLPVACVHEKGADRDVNDIREALIKVLSHSYVQALQKLPIDEMPEMLSCLIYAGHTYGVLEPVNNIIINAIISYKFGGKCTGVLIDGSIYDPLYWTEAANISLGGLVVFLRSYFYCLSEEQAIGYLFLSNADPMLAIGLIERDQNVVSSFDKVTTRTQIALTHAAHFAGHPNPEDMATKMTGCYLSESIVRLRMRLRSTKISKNLVLEVAKLLEGYTKGFDSKGGQTLYSLRNTCYVPFEIVKLKINQRRQDWTILDDAQCGYIKMLKMLIVDGDLKVYHLSAISKLSRDAVSRLHRGLVVAGHSFGPFEIPSHNIILNAIWYTLTFPEDTQGDETRVSLLCSDQMFNVNQQSLDGSIVYLQERYSRTRLSKHEAVEFFYCARGILREAEKLASDSGHMLSCSETKALEVATKSMGYTWSDDMSKCIGALQSGLGSQLRGALMNIDGEISVGDVNSLTEMMSQRLLLPLTSLPKLVLPSSASIKDMLAAERTKYLALQSFLEEKVKELLRADESTEELELHSICGAARHLSKSRKFYHVNFWASKKGIHSDMDPKVRDLFFAEIWVTPTEDHKSFLSKLIYVVKGRCFCCELSQNKLWHPVNAVYVGLDEDAFGNFLDTIWTRAQKPKRYTSSDYFYFNFRTDVRLAERVVEASEKKTEYLEYV